MKTALGLTALLIAAPKSQRPIDRCTTLLECELSCPEISVQGQRKSPQGKEITFCDPVGEEVYWHNERTRASQGERFGDKRTGKWRFWHPNGVLASQENYTDRGMVDGKQQFWYPNRTKKRVAHYREGIRDGSYTTWHPNGRKSEVRQYKEGNLIGELREWHANGRLAALGTIKDKTITWERFFTTGKIGLRGQVESTSQRLELGEQVQPIGEWFIYSTRGKVLVHMQFTAGQLDGHYKRFYDNGKPMLVEQYTKGQPVDIHLSYFKGGQVSKKQEFQDAGQGQAHGIFERYFPNGNVRQSGHYTKGKKSGEWFRYNREGYPVEKIDYDQQPPQQEGYDHRGAKRSSGTLKNGLKSGLWRYFDSQENKRAKGEYQRGVRQGLWRFWSSDGKPQAKGEFDQGRRVGPWRYDHPGGGKWFLVKAIKATGTGDNKRYLHKGRRLFACEKLAQDDRCEGLSIFDAKERLRVRFTFPSNWRQAATRACQSGRRVQPEFCEDDHGDILHAIDSLDKLISRRRLQRQADCWSAGGEPERCPVLDGSIVPFQGLGSIKGIKARQVSLPFSTCSSAESCAAECQDWATQNDPFASIYKAKRSARELRCDPSGPFVVFHRPKERLAAIVGARALPHRQAPRSEFHGPWTSYHANGSVAAKGSYNKGVKNGEWIRWHANGKKAHVVTYKQGLESGQSKSWHDSGHLRSNGHYKNGIRFGVWSFRNDRGQSQSKGAFKNGRRHGRWLLYDDLGKPRSKGNYRLGRMVGRWTYFDARGRKNGMCSWSPKGDGDFQDCRRNNGVPIRKGLVVEGAEEGLWTYFHRNGKKRAQGPMRAGVRQGTWRFWHNNGKKRAKGAYINGQKSEAWTCWSKTGQRVKCKKAQ